MHQSIRIETLGHFRVRKGGLLLDAGTVRSRELLMAILTAGGESAHHAALSELLWPDADGDLARKSFDTTLHRLRRWLGVPGAVLLRGGEVSINPEVCVVDARELDERLGRLSAVPSPEAIAPILALYRGRFLPDAPFGVRLRERLHRRVVALVERAGAALEREGQLVEARSLYERGLEIDDERESFYQGLMRCAGEAGRASEVKSLARSCSKILADRFQGQPSNETLSLVRRYGGAPLEATRRSGLELVG